MTKRLIPGILTLLLFVVFGTHAAALAPTASPEPWHPNGQVRAALVVGDVLWLGGDFTRLVSPDGGESVSRRFLAGIDLRTGRPMRPTNTNGSVTAMEAAEDRTTLFVVGGFRSIGGAFRPYAAALNARTGRLLPWTPEGEAIPPYNTVSVSSEGVCVGGWFGSVLRFDGTFAARSGVACFDVRTGKLLPRPTIQTGLPVISMKASKDFTVVGTAGQLIVSRAGRTIMSPLVDGYIRTIMFVSRDTIVIGGSFARVDDSIASGIARINLRTGEVTQLGNFIPSDHVEVFAIARSGRNGENLVLGGEIYRGGAMNEVLVIDPFGHEEVAALVEGEESDDFGPTVRAIIPVSRTLIFVGVFSGVDGSPARNMFIHGATH